MSENTAAEATDEVLVVGLDTDELPPVDRDKVRREIEESGEEIDDLDAMFEAIDEDHEEIRESLAGRGKVRFDFGPGKLGYANTYDHAGQQDYSFLCTNVVVLNQWVQPIYANLAGLSPEQARTLPLACFENFDLANGDDEVFMALVENPGVHTFYFTSTVSEAQAAALLEEDEYSPIKASDHVISDRAFASLAQAKALRFLELSTTAATDETIAAVISQLPELIGLKLTGPAMTGSFVPGLAGREIDQLGVSGDNVRAMELCSGEPLPAVGYLRVGGAQVLDGLDPKKLIATFPNLDALTVDKDGIELADLLPLHAAKPGLDINGLTLSERAIAKSAAKLGVAL